MPRLSLSFTALIFGLLISPALATTYNEGVDGDISGTMGAPTGFPLTMGSNLLTATSVSGDREYVHVSIPSGLGLSAIDLTAYAGVDGVAFIGVQAGSVFTEPFSGTNPANLLGYAHFGPSTAASVGTDILDDIGTGAGSQGFTPPLTGTDYTFWIQQTGANASTYTLNFLIVPEPSSLMLLGLGGIAVVGSAYRRRKS